MQQAGSIKLKYPQIHEAATNAIHCILSNNQPSLEKILKNPWKTLTTIFFIGVNLSTVLSLSSATAAPVAIKTIRVKVFECESVWEVLLLEETSEISPGLLSKASYKSRLIIPGQKAIYEGRTDVFHGDLAHFFEGVSWAAGTGPSSGVKAASLQTDVNMTSTGLFEEGSFLYLGTDKFKCKEQNGKTAIRNPDPR